MYPQRPTWNSQAPRSGWFALAGDAARSLVTTARGPVVIEANGPALAYAMQVQSGIRDERITPDFVGISRSVWSDALAYYSRRQADGDTALERWTRTRGPITGDPADNALLLPEDLRLLLWLAAPALRGVRLAPQFSPGDISIPADTIRPRFGARLAVAGSTINWMEATNVFEAAR